MTSVRQLPELLNLQEACDLLHVSRATMYRWIDTKRVQSIRYPNSNRRLIEYTEVKRIIDEGKQDFTPDYETCSSITVKGERCTNRPIDGQVLCGSHVGESRIERGVSNASL